MAGLVRKIYDKECENRKSIRNKAYLSIFFSSQNKFKLFDYVLEALFGSKECSIVSQ